MRNLKRSIVGVLLALVLTACATSPTGRPQLMLVSERQAISQSALAYVEVIGALEKDGRISTDAALRDRIHDITGRLIREAIDMRPVTADWEWSIKIIDDPKMVNAWCMAGGRMAVYTGLVEQIQPSDDELAQVIGHEIAHALANHTAEKMSIALASSLGVAAVSIASDRPYAGAAASVAAVLAVQLPNSRTAETEADRIGIELAARAGYDPRASVTLWQKMEAVGKSSTPQFLSTHPSAGLRQKRLGILVEQMMPLYRESRPRQPYPL